MAPAKSLFMHWVDKAHNATVVSATMESDFVFSAPSDSWVPKWLWALKRGEDIVQLCERSGTPQDPLNGLNVLEFLNSTPFASTRQIATATKIPRSTVLDHLDGRGYTLRHLKWVLHHLTAAMME
jgi:hypothetical protein